MKTRVYFVRHAQSDGKHFDDPTRPLTEKGQKDTKAVADFLRDKGIEIAMSSPYKRSVDTISKFCEEAGLDIETDSRLREWKMGMSWFDSMEEYTAYTKQHWGNFLYTDGESETLGEVQERNIALLLDILNEHNGKNIVIGTHGMALSLIKSFRQCIWA